MLKDALLAAALSLRAWHGDTETTEERSDRLTIIAEAISEASREATCTPPRADDCIPVWFGERRELAFLLLTQAHFETHLARHVHEGRCRVARGECDGGRAVSLWQLHAGPQLSRERWQSLIGAEREPTERAAYEAARALGRAKNHCGTTHGAIALYATGKSCTWDDANRRAAFARRLSDRF